MADETPLPDDDGTPKLWCWTTDQHPNFVRVADYPITREAAIKRLRDQQPADLNGATSVTLGIENRYDLDELPIRAHATGVRVRYTEQEQTNRMLASSMGGFTIDLPGRSR